METVQDKESVHDLLELTVKEYGDREAMYDQISRLSYEELLEQSNKVAQGMKDLGVTKGDKVGVCLPNWNETVIVFFASAMLGAVVVPFNTMYRSHEIEFILKDAEPKALYVSEQILENGNVETIAELVPSIVSVRFENELMISFRELLQSNDGKEVKKEVVDASKDLLCILYTSGTTGRPKGVMITHQSVSKCALAVVEEMQCTDKDVFLVPAPLFHIFGIACNLIAAVGAGARMVLMEKFKPRQALELIEQEQVTVQQGVPTMFLKEIEVDGFEQYNLSSLRTGMVGAAPISPEQMKKIRKKMNFHLCQSFGSSETSGGVTINKINDDETEILETVGKPFQGIQLKIVDEQREKLPVGYTGEIAVNSFGNMKGYYKMPVKTAEILDNEGWYYTGDLGAIDERGNLRLVGRVKEMIVRGGFNIYPQEIEALLHKHDSISTAAVIGLPDETLGEVVCAVIQLRLGEKMTEAEVKDYVSAHLAVYKTPASIIFTDHLPMTASGKIQKGKLREQISGQY
ncbi:class I adenylate-forming enzyme family protein [Salsuginibacillus kocurii]|uniref:class I adenylate-forming enzyme family protein n=1 Tax=Salsuginibacillus kocurii TaxID=427078 RepID=UPI0003729F33|nr:class I adenylate-forming enzyme family protein [Salsuginibacillus kocurii]